MISLVNLSRTRGLAKAGLVAIACTLVLGACASTPSDPEEAAEAAKINDPLEPMNRKIFSFNLAVDDALLKPVAKGYRAVIPQGGRDAVKNFLDNLKAPLVFAHDVAQGEMGRAGQTAKRFAMNSTVGIVGIFDFSGIEHHSEDLGQTLGVWGFEGGPYLVLPILGPSVTRDTLGMVGDFYLDPVNWYLRRTDRMYLNWVRNGVRGVDTRERNLETLDDIERTAIDLYATYRSLYKQHRQTEILNGKPKEGEPMAILMEDYDEEDGEDGEITLLKNKLPKNE